MTQAETALLVGGIALLFLLVIHVRREEVESFWYEQVRRRLDAYLDGGE